MNSTADVPLGRLVLASLQRGLGQLEAKRQEINDLNVYPVPDGDTGTNLVLTVRSIVSALAQETRHLTKTDLYSQVTQAALMGARGNSGVILSQIIRGACEVLGTSEAIDSQTITRAFRQATDTAYRAVRRPVEGTMLTVLRQMTEAAEKLADATEVPFLLAEVIAAGERSVQETPRLLKALADAEVVDAGGYGLVVLLRGMFGESPVDTVGYSRELSPIEPAPAAPTVRGESSFGYCTSYLVTGKDLDRDQLEERLNRLGDCVLAAGDSRQIKVHLHTDQPGRALELGTAMGTVSHIEIENMDEQANARLAGGASAADAGPNDSPQTQLVAVVVGEGNKELFRDLGVDFIVDGGQSMNPSTNELLQAVDSASSPGVIILPNNANVIMAAEQTCGLATRDVYVIPSRSMQAGLSAAVAFDRRLPVADNFRAMLSASEKVASGEVTRAIRSTNVDGFQVRERDFIGLVDDSVVAASRDLSAVIGLVTDRLLDGDRELLTALLGEGDDALQAAAALQTVSATHPDVEIQVHQGGQAFYPILLAAE